MSLKLIMAVSADGYLADGPNDDMSWTGKLDKLVFRLLTSIGGPLGAGKRTFFDLPELKGREVICLTSRRDHELFIHKPNFKISMGPDDLAAIPKDSAIVAHRVMTLQEFARCHPGAWLIGGPETAAAAIDMNVVAEAIMCHGTATLGGGIPDTLSARFEEAKWLQTKLQVGLGDEAVRTVIWKKGAKP